MSELLEAPSAPKAFWEFLANKTGKAAGGLIPNPRPAEFYRVRLSGGSSPDVASAQPTVIVESYAKTYEKAEQNSRRADALLMQASRDGWLLTVPVRSIQTVSLPQDLPDPVTELPRFTATYAPILRRSAVTVP